MTLYGPFCSGNTYSDSPVAVNLLFNQINADCVGAGQVGKASESSYITRNVRPAPYLYQIAATDNELPSYVEVEASAPAYDGYLGSVNINVDPLGFSLCP